MKRKLRSMALPGQLPLLFDNALEKIENSTPQTPTVYPAPGQQDFLVVQEAQPMAIGMNRFDYRYAICNGSTKAFKRHLLLLLLGVASGSGIGSFILNLFRAAHS
jgi:hypothetical protein